MLVVVVLMPIEVQDLIVKGNRPACSVKVEPTEEEVKKPNRETLEKLQGKKGGKSKAAIQKRQRDTHRQKSDDEQRALDEGSKTIRVLSLLLLVKLPL
jgi:translation initiation factor IF-2